MIHFLLLISRQGKVRLGKWYSTYSQKERAKIIKDVSGMILGRSSKQCNFLDFRDQKIVYKRYASLYFAVAIDAEDNELHAMDTVHHFVECLDRLFGNVCELDLIFNFHKAYYILDEVLLGGELQESSKLNVVRTVEAHDEIVEQAKMGLLDADDPNAGASGGRPLGGAGGGF
ncbi:unnamed protein product [Pedinophyceae sp. YPF-701]|nr:unnamed protein product [Pedinophyceae sp. YPF-701]